MKKITTLLFLATTVFFVQRMQSQVTQNTQTVTFSAENQSIWGPGSATVYDERLNLFEDNGIDASELMSTAVGEVLYLNATEINDAIEEVNNAIESYNDVFDPNLPTIPTQSSYPFGAEFDLKLGVNFDFYVDILISSGDADITYPTKFTFSYPDPLSFGCGDDVIIETSAMAESGYDLNLQEPILEIETGASIGTGAYINGELCAIDCTDLGQGYSFGNDFGNATSANFKSKLLNADIGFIGVSTNVGLQLPWDLNPGLGIAGDLFGGTPPLLTLPLETSDIPPFAGGLTFEGLTFITASVDNPFVDLNGNDFLNGNILTDNSSNTFLHAEWDPIQYLKYMQPQFQLTYGKTFLGGDLGVQLTLASLPLVLDVTQDHTFELSPDFITDMDLGRVLSWEEYDGNTLVQSGTSQVVTGFVMGHSLKIVGYPDNVETPVVPTFNINAEFQTKIEEQFDIDLELKFMQGNINFPAIPFTEILDDLIADLDIPDLTFTVPNLFDPEQCDCTAVGVPSIDCIPDPAKTIVPPIDQYPCGIGVPPPMCDCDDIGDPSPLCVPDPNPANWTYFPVDTYTCFPDHEFNLTQIFTDAISESSIAAGNLQVGPFPMPTPSFDVADFEIDVLDKTFAMGGFNTILGSPFTLKPDDVPPVVVTQTIIRDIVGYVVVDPVLPQDVVASAIDEHGGTIEYISVTPNTFDCSNVGDNIVMVTVGDSRCNETTVSAIVTVRDVTDPVWVNAPTNLTVECDGAGNLAEFDNWLNNTFSGTDNCLNPVITNNFASLSDDCGGTGSQTVTFTLSDGSNFITADATFIIEDTTPPIIGCPGDVTAYTENGDCGAIVNFQNAAAIEDCGDVFVYVTEGLGSGSLFPIGDTLIEFTAQDECGNSSTCNFTITVVDDDAPEAVCQNITVQLDEFGFASITPDEVNFGSSDNCGVDTLSIDIDTFDCSNVGENEVIFTVTDLNGNSSTCTTIVTIEDVTAPDVVCNNITVELDANGTVTIDPMDVAVGSSDACGIANYELNIDTFTCLDVGNSTVILTVTDVNGNQSSCSTTITVEDNIAPELFCMDILLELNQDGVAFITPAMVVDANDPCGILVLSTDIDQVTCADIGTPVTVNIFANDGNGNSSFCSSTVTVVDILGPQIVCPEDEQVNLDANGTYTLGDYIGDGTATATDNCTDPVTIFSQDPTAGTLLGLGTHVISFTAEDEYGNVTTCSFEIDVQEILGNSVAELGSLILYPNPADNYVHLSNPNYLELYDVSIYDITGRLISKLDVSNMGEEVTIDVSNFASATYMLIINGAKGVTTKQLIVE